MDEEELQKWETVMLATYQNDKSLIDAAQNEIFGLLQQQSFDVFIEILQNSCEPLARKAASTYFCRDVEMHLKEITLNKRKKICNFILGNIMIPNQDIVIIQNYIEIIRLFASSSHKLLPEIEQFIVEIQNDPNIIRLNLLVKVIPFLKPDYVEQRYQMFSNIACNFLQLDNWDIINISISLTKVLLSCSKDIRGYENAFVRLCQLCPIVINEPVNIQNNYWNRLGELIQIGVCPPDLILAILTSISNDSISPDSALSALTAIQPSIRVLQLEQVLGVINISIINAVKFTETEGLPPDDFIGPIVEAFTYFPHQPIYQFIKTKINEILTTKGINAAAITLFSPILSESFEQLSDDMLFLRDLLKSGLQTNDSLIVQSCCSLLAEFEETHQFSSFINEIMIYIYPYLIVEDKDVRHQAFRCVQAILFDQYIQGSLEAIWSIKDQIKQEDQWSYMDILGLSINNEAEINDQQISAILEFALTFIRQPTHIMLKSYSLYILAKLIVHDEDSIMNIINDTKESIILCLKSRNDEIQEKALSFLHELLIIYKLNAIGFVLEFWSYISNFIQRKVLNSSVRLKVLQIASLVARFGNKYELVPEIIQSLQTLANKSYHDDIIILCIQKLIPILNDEQSQILFNYIITRCKETDDIDTGKNCFHALAKFLKYCKQNNSNLFYNVSFQLCQQFFEGNLPFLYHKSLLNPNDDININLLDIFFDFVSRILMVKSDINDQLFKACIKVLERPQESYQIVVFSNILIVFDTISQENLQKLISLIPQLIQTKDTGLRGSISFFMLLLLKKYPSFYESFKALIPILLNWFKESIINFTSNSDNSDNGYLTSNLSSLFLEVACIDRQFPNEVVLQALRFFPPKDHFETDNMAKCILTLFSNIQNVEPIILKNVALAIAKFIALPNNKLEKCKVDPVTSQNLIMLFKTIVGNYPDILSAVFEELKEKQSNVKRIMNVLQ